MRRTLGCILILSLAGCGDNLPGKPDPKDRPKLPDQVTDFDKLFTQNCSGCHGAEGKVGPAPPLNDPLFLAIVPDVEVLKVIREGRHGTMMPGFDRDKDGSLTSDQIEILAAGIKEHWGKPHAKADGAPAYLAKGAGDAKAGAKVFAAACAGCHGDDGQGDKGAGAINDPAFLGLMSDRALRRIVITGRPDLGMPSYAENKGRAKDFKPLTERDVADVTAFVAGWRRTVGGKP